MMRNTIFITGAVEEQNIDWTTHLVGLIKLIFASRTMNKSKVTSLFLKPYYMHLNPLNCTIYERAQLYILLPQQKL